MIIQEQVSCFSFPFWKLGDYLICDSVDTSVYSKMLICEIWTINWILFGDHRKELLRCPNGPHPHTHARTPTKINAPKEKSWWDSWDVVGSVGLDPAGPHFEFSPTWVRLDPSDATLVDAIHTDGYHYLGFLGLGLMQPVSFIFINRIALARDLRKGPNDISKMRSHIVNYPQVLSENES